jgi:hypothetical protein
VTRVRAATVVFALLSVLLLAGCGAGGSASASSDPASIIESQCTRCHPVDRIKIAQHDAAGWQNTVQRMISVHGAQLDDTQAQAVVAFLADGGASKL